MVPRPTPVLALLFLLAACSPEPAAAPGDAPGAGIPADPAVWWTEATRLPSGRERILAPRELRELLAQGAAWGFDSNEEWWGECRHWVFERVLRVDPTDVAANEALGRRTLRGLIPDFDALWEHIQMARVRSEAGEALLDRYDDALLDGHPIFLVRAEAEEALALLRAARSHLERLDSDPRYRAEQLALGRVRNSVLGDYPFVHRFVGPFLICFTARDLQRIPGEDPDAEDARLATARALYARRLDERAPTLQGLLDDVRTTYPELLERRPIGEDAVFVQWTFGDRAMYGDFTVRAQIEDPPVGAYRCGFLHVPSGFAYLYEPSLGDAASPEEERAAEASAERTLRETSAYLGAQQLLHYWAVDPDDAMVDQLERSRAYWLKVGWPAWMASRRVENSPVGTLLNIVRAAAPHDDPTAGMPRLEDVVARRGRLEHGAVLMPEGFERAPIEGGDGFTDLAWALVAHLNSEKYHAPFVRYLISQLSGERRDVAWFEECFGIKDAGDWRSLQRAVYARGSDNG